MYSIRLTPLSSPLNNVHFGVKLLPWGRDLGEERKLKAANTRSKATEAAQAAQVRTTLRGIYDHCINNPQTIYEIISKFQDVATPKKIEKAVEAMVRSGCLKKKNETIGEGLLEAGEERRGLFRKSFVRRTENSPALVTYITNDTRTLGIDNTVGLDELLIKNS